MTKEQHPNDIAYSKGYKQGVFDTEMRYQTIDTPEAISRVGGNEKLKLEFIQKWDSGQFEWNHHEGDELGIKPNSLWRVWNEFIEPAITTKDQEKEEAVKAEQMRIKKEIAFHTPALTAKKPKAYNDGLLSGWYACREFVNLLTRALPTEDNK